MHSSEQAIRLSARQSDGVFLRAAVSERSQCGGFSARMRRELAQKFPNVVIRSSEQVHSRPLFVHVAGSVRSHPATQPSDANPHRRKPEKHPLVMTRNRIIHGGQGVDESQKKEIHRDTNFEFAPVHLASLHYARDCSVQRKHFTTPSPAAPIAISAKNGKRLLFQDTKRSLSVQK